MNEGQRPSRHYRRILTRKGYKAILINPNIKKKVMIRKRYVQTAKHKMGFFDFLKPRKEGREQIYDDEEISIGSGPREIKRKSKQLTQKSKIIPTRKKYLDAETQKEYEKMQEEKEELESAVIDIEKQAARSIRNFSPKEETKTMRQMDKVNQDLEKVPAFIKKIEKSKKVSNESIQSYYKDINTIKNKNKEMQNAYKRTATLVKILVRANQKKPKTVEEYNELLKPQDLEQQSKLYADASKVKKMKEELVKAEGIANQLVRTGLKTDKVNAAKSKVIDLREKLSKIKYSDTHVEDTIARTEAYAKELKKLPKDEKDFALIKQLETAIEKNKKNIEELRKKDTKKEMVEQQKRVKEERKGKVAEHREQAIVDTYGPKGLGYGKKAKGSLVYEDMAAGKTSSKMVEQIRKEVTKDAENVIGLDKKRQAKEKNLEQARKVAIAARQSANSKINLATGKPSRNKTWNRVLGKNFTKPVVRESEKLEQPTIKKPIFSKLERKVERHGPKLSPGEHVISGEDIGRKTSWGVTTASVKKRIEKTENEVVKNTKPIISKKKTKGEVEIRS